ncbi:MAG: UDP-galactopyranose mutase [Candidatus Saccharibacteria bacterium]|nr:UDP-galactopyranose mutase [Candidatus Saccharibacteria bacterium]
MDLTEYQYIVAGAGIFGATVAERLANKGKKVLVVEKRPHLAGNIYSYTDKETGIEVHKYGSHIFHTESDEVWNYITRFTNFNDYIHTVDTRHNGKLYPMPINLDTINLLYEKNLNAQEAEEFIKAEAERDSASINNPKNFEEQGITLVGEKLYEAFLKNYTAKQWNTDPKNLSVDLLKRIPVRFSHDNRYFITAKHQGIPVNGYTKIIEKMLSSDNITIKLNTDFKSLDEIPSEAKIIYCGTVDELMDYQLGVLPYRSLRFEEERINNSEQTQAVINEADPDIPYTRTHNYKYYQIHQPEIIEQSASIICREYPADFKQDSEAYYPINNPDSMELYNKYVELIKDKYPNMVLGGRLGKYQYWDMDKAILAGLETAKNLLA